MAEAVRKQPKHKRKKKTKTEELHSSKIEDEASTIQRIAVIQPRKGPEILLLPNADKEEEASKEENVGAEESHQNLQNASRDINRNIVDHTEEASIPSTIENKEVNRNRTPNVNTLDNQSEESNRNIDSGIGGDTKILDNESEESSRNIDPGISGDIKILDDASEESNRNIDSGIGGDIKTLDNESEETSRNTDSGMGGEIKTLDNESEESSRNTDSGMGGEIDNNKQIHAFYSNNEALISQNDVLDEGSFQDSLGVKYEVGDNINAIIPTAPPPSILSETENTEHTTVPQPLPISQVSDNVTNLKEDEKHSESNTLSELSDVSSPYAKLRPRLNAIVKESNPLVKAKDENAAMMVPFTDEQLNFFYYNHELEQLNVYVEEFLKSSKKVRCEFEDLIESYYKSRLKLIDVHEKIKNLQETGHKERKDAWTISQCTYTARGICGCGVNVKQEHRYQQAKYEDSKGKQLNTDLVTLRGLVYETCQLQSYNSQTAKIRVDNYLFKLFQRNTVLKNLKVEQPISTLLPNELDPYIVPVLQNLQECISVLFSFKRLGSLEGEFSADLQQWLDMLVAALQRIGSQADSFFLLNHILRCPQGEVASLAHFIQFPSFGSEYSTSVSKKPQVHHFIIMLATLTLPVKSRKEFLSKSHINKNIISSGGGDTEWTLLDEHAEEAERSEDSWCLMNEHDLMSVFAQFPFTSLLIAFLHIEVTDNGMLNHSPAKTLSHDIMNFFAFSSCLVKLLGQIFETYNMLRYRQFLKTISHTIRFLTQIVSDQWASYRQYRLDFIGDTYISLPQMADSGMPVFALERLQIEFDQFFLRASKQIISSGSSGALQFLTTMPFEAVSSSSAWTFLHLIINQDVELTSVMTISLENLPCVKTLNVSPSKGIFLLTALSNMAKARDESDKVFIETVAKLILDVSFLNASLEDLFFQNGRDMLISISEKHTFIISSLLNHVNSQLEQLEKFLVYIFESLPLQLWKPLASDIETIRSWLLGKPLVSEENKLARILLLKLNYDLDENGVQLFLPRNFHFMIAILLVEAYGISFPDYAGGIKDLNYDQMGIMHQVSQIAVSSYTKIVYSQVHVTFSSWAWEVMLMLKLHESEAPNEECEDTCQFGSSSSETWSENMLQGLKYKRCSDFDIKETIELLNVHLALQCNGLLAAYVASAMTKHGHFVDQFLSNGLMYLTQLNNAALYGPVLRIVSHVARVFITCPEKLYSNQSFVNVLMALIHLDVNQAGYTEKIWQYFVTGTYSQTLAALVTTHVIQANKFSQQQAQKVIKYWTTLFVKLPMWSKDCSILYQIDCLCKVAFTTTNTIDSVCNVLFGEFQELIKSQQKPRGLLSSVISWISHDQAISFMKSHTTDFCYYAYAVLCVEMRYEQEIGLSVGLTTEMVMDPTKTVLEAYKQATTTIKAVYVPHVNALSIYRWGEQAMVTPSDHPFLPIIWQQFFQIFLQKPSESSGLPCRTGIGLRYFDETIPGSLSKKMKNTLYTVAKYHKTKTTEDGTTSKDSEEPFQPPKSGKEHAYTKEFHNTLSEFYQALALWLEESRLHDPNLFLSSLPDVYNPDLLLRVFQGSKELWYEFVDSANLLKGVDALSSLWRSSIYKPNIQEHIDHITGMTSEITPSSRIIKRLKNENSPQSPLNVTLPQSHVPEISFNVLLTQPRLMQDTAEDLQGMVAYAKTMSSLLATQIGLDSEFLEQLPNMYENINRKLVVGIPCEKKGKSACSDPAEVTIELTELQLRSRIYKIIEDNRREFDELILKCCKPVDDALCNGVVHVEMVIRTLSESFDSLNAAQQQDLQNSARHLFYLLAELIDGDVKRCHPAIQFFSSGVEKLGKKFIADIASEQLSLLNSISDQEQSVMFLAPYFTPMSALNCFIELYTTVAELISERHATIVFVLLSKFDLNIWLSTSICLSDKITMAALVMKAMIKIGAKPDTEDTVILESIRSHMVILMNNDVNLMFSKMLLEFLDGSNNSTIAIVCWDDFTSCLGYDKEEVSNQLCIEQVKESIQFLASYFANILDNCNYQLEVLYEGWEPYLNALNQLLSGLFRQLIYYTASQVTVSSKEDLLREIWEHILSVYQAWLIPRASSKIWSLLRMDSIMCLIKTFTDCIRLTIKLFSHEGDYCVFLNYVWTYYFQFIVPSVKEEQSLEMFHSFFATLPWVSYCPTVQELNFMLQSYDPHPSAFCFCGSLLSEIDWPIVVKSYLALDNLESTRRLHQQLFHILAMMAANKLILEKFSSKLTYLFKTAKTFEWDLLTVEETGRACNWYAENVEAALILERSSFVYSTLDLFLHVCGYNNVTGDGTADELAISKRNLYVQVVVSLLTRCSSLKDRVYEFRYVMDKLLNTIETTFKYNKINPLQELIMHASSTLNILNAVTTLPIYEAVLASVESYLLSTGCGMMVLAFISATSMSVASLDQMVFLLEKAISCHFMRLSEGELLNSWTPVVNAFVVPELQVDEFVKAALKQQAMLTLYTYNVHRIPKSETQGEQLAVLVDIVQWCTQTQPNKENESKFLLLWLQVFNVVRIQTAMYKSQSEFQQLAKYIVYFSNACEVHSEEKSYGGVLGMIGIGRRSPLSKEFRITAKSVHLFLMCQLPSSGIPLRASPNAPGAIRNSTDTSVSATTETEKLFTAFEGLLKHKSHAAMHDHIKWIIDFISNPRTNINDGCSLVAYLCKAFFEKENFIAASVT